MLLDIGKIRRNGECQIRVEMRADVIDDYAEPLMHDPDAQVSPVIVFFDGTDYWLADGYHRCGAYDKAQRSEIPVEVKTGGRRDALRYALGANSLHGLRRTNADKRHAVEIALADEEWGNWSNPQIAELCGVAESTVRNIKASLRNLRSEDQDDSEEEVTYVTKHGTKATMKTGNIGKTKRERKEDDDEPEIPEVTEDMFSGLDNGEPAELFDQAGQPLPPQAQEAFSQLPELNALLRQLDQIAREIERVGKMAVGLHTHWQSARSLVREAKQYMRAGRPAFVCPYCSGEQKDCSACYGHGFVITTTYEQSPPEMKVSKRAGEGGAA
jgi:hypothetical protein